MLKIGITEEYKEIFTTKASIIILMGGRARGGSGTAVRFAAITALSASYERIYFMRQIYGDIDQSLFKDFKDFVIGAGLSSCFRIGERPATPIKALRSGNEIISKGFKKSDNTREAKVKSLAGVTKVIIEEANEVSEEDFDQLRDSLRTDKGLLQIILVLNPPHKDHWILSRWFDLIPFTEEHEHYGYYNPIPKPDSDLCAIITDFTHNKKNLDPAFVERYTTGYKKTNPHYHKVTCLGLVSAGLTGVVYSNYAYVDSFPDWGLETRWGLDFGFTDPTAIVKTQTHKLKKWVQEIMYETGVNNQRRYDILVAAGVGTDVVVCDNASAEQIADLIAMGINAVPCIKGAGSVEAGIEILQAKTIYIVGDCPNLTYEARHYIVDSKTKKLKGPHHLWDATRYEDYELTFNIPIPPTTQEYTKRQGNTGNRKRHFLQSSEE